MGDFSRQLSVIANKLLSVLRTIKEEILSLRDTIHEEAEANRKSENSQSIQDSPKPAIASLSGTAKAMQVEYRNSQRQQKKHQCHILIADWAGVLVVAAYTTFTAFQWSDLRHNFKVDERAWIAPFEVTVQEREVKKGFSIFGAIVNYKNTGKTAAVNGKVFIDQRTSLATIPTSDTKPRTQDSPTFLLAPSGINHSSIWFSDDSADAFNKTQRSVFVFGTIWYDDIFRTEHWTQFCFEAVREKMTGIKFEPCPVHNTCDDCDKTNSP